MATTARKSAKRTSNKQFDDAQLTKFYEDMLLIRRFEEKAGQLYGMGLIGGFCHLYIGQEAVVVGIQHELETGKDSVITGYRDHGHMLATGMDPDGVMAELTGRSGGYSKGKGGSMHMFSTEKRFFGGHGIVAAQVSLGAGLAFAHKYNDDGGISVAYYGDGAANQGQVADDEHGVAVAVANLVRVRKQPLCDGNIERARRCDHRLCGTGQALRYSRCAGGWHGRGSHGDGSCEGG